MIFWQSQTIRFFEDSIFSDKITLSETDKKQTNLLENILIFNSKLSPRSKDTFEKVTALHESRKLTLNLFKVDNLH